MPTTRSRRTRARGGLTPEAIAAFRAGDDAALRVALGLKPWQWPTLPPLDEQSCYPPQSAGSQWWPMGQDLHRELIAAAASKVAVNGD